MSLRRAGCPAYFPGTGPGPPAACARPCGAARPGRVRRAAGASKKVTACARRSFQHGLQLLRAAPALGGVEFSLHPWLQRPDAAQKCLRRVRAGGALRTLKMAVDDLRDVDRLADAPIGCGVKDKVLQPVAAPLIEAQPQQRRAAVEGVPYKLWAAVLQKSTVAAAAGPALSCRDFRQGAAARQRYRPGAGAAAHSRRAQGRRGCPLPSAKAGAALPARTGRHRHRR